jgi:hypothetical protein
MSAIRFTQPAKCDVLFIRNLSRNSNAIGFPKYCAEGQSPTYSLRELRKRALILQRGLAPYGFVYATPGWDEFLNEPIVELKRFCVASPSSVQSPEEQSQAQSIELVRIVLAELAKRTESRLAIVQFQNDDRVAREVTDALRARDRLFTLFSARLPAAMIEACRRTLQVDLPGPSALVGESLTVREATIDDIPILIEFAKDTDRRLGKFRLLRSKEVQGVQYTGEEVYRRGLRYLIRRSADSLGRYFVFCDRGRVCGKVKAYIDHDWPAGIPNLMFRCFYFRRDYCHRGLLEKFIAGVVGLLARKETQQMKTLVYGDSRKAFENLENWSADDLWLYREMALYR